MESNHGLLSSLIKTFGNKIISAEGIVDKMHINELLGDEKTKALLDKLVYWPIIKVVLWRVFKARVWRGKDMVALSASSLYETKVLEFVCFPIIVVYIDN